MRRSDFEQPTPVGEIGWREESGETLRRRPSGSAQCRDLPLCGQQDVQLPGLPGCQRSSCLRRPASGQSLPDARRSRWWPDGGRGRVPGPAASLRTLAPPARHPECRCHPPGSPAQTASPPVLTLVHSMIQLELWSCKTYFSSLQLLASVTESSTSRDFPFPKNQLSTFLRLGLARGPGIPPRRREGLARDSVPEVT